MVCAQLWQNCFVHSVSVFILFYILLMYSLCSEHYDKIEGEAIVDIQHKHEDDFET